jgi:hypothetical protein
MHARVSRHSIVSPSGLIDESAVGLGSPRFQRVGGVRLIGTLVEWRRLRNDDPHSVALATSREEQRAAERYAARSAIVRPSVGGVCSEAAS